MNEMPKTFDARNRLIMGRLCPDLEQVLWRLISDEKQDDVLAPVTVIAPSRYAALALRQELGRTGFVNVRFMVFSMLAEMLGAATLERQGRKPLTGVVETVMLRRVLAQTTAPLAGVREHPSTLFSVRGAFRQLRSVEGRVRTTLMARDDLSGDVARMHERYRELVRPDWYDVDDLAEAAADETRSGATPGLDDLGSIVFYLPRETSPAEVGLIESLGQRHRCAVVLGATGDPTADQPVMELANTLDRTFGPPEAAVEWAEQIPVLPDSANLHVSPNAHEELRWVIRQVVNESEANQTPLHRMAILYRMADPYATLIRDELRMAGIPMAGPDAETLANTAVGRTLRGLLSLSGNDFQRTEMMAWLSGNPVLPRGEHARRFNPSQWDKVARKAGIVGGLQQWRGRLTSHAHRLENDADRREAAGEISVARARGMRAEAESARDLLAFVESLAADLRPPPSGRKLAEFARWAGGLLTKYLAPNITPSENAVLERITRALDEFNTADSVESVADAAVFREMVDDALQAPFGHLGPTGQGVFVSSIAASAGMTFEAVWVVGMIEGAVPPPGFSDPLLPEQQWRASGGHDRLGQRMADERYRYLSMMNGATRRTLSYPVAHPASQRQAYPSRWLLEQATVLEGKRVQSSDLGTLHGRDWLTVSSSAEAALLTAQGPAPADDHDYRLHRLLHWRRSGRPFNDHPFVGSNPLAAGIRLARTRFHPGLTEFDGNLSSLSDDGHLGAGLVRAPVSPTGLESWATCPYRYFLGNVLGLRALDSPEETVSISALDRGALIHEILERFIRESVANGHLPSAGEPWGPDDRARLLGIADASFQSAEATGATGKRLLWAMDKATILSDLETFLEEDSETRSRHGTAQIQVETGFGFGGDTTDVVDSETGARFRGSIDRVDATADGGSVFVIDYKTGSARPYGGLEDDVIDGGRHLQLGVYSLAAQALFPDATRVEAAYWFTTNRGGFSFAPSDRFDITDPDTADRFRDGVSRIVSGINAGLFPANPGPLDRGAPANCRYCDFDAVCPSRRRDLWNLKKSDVAVADYLELTGES